MHFFFTIFLEIKIFSHKKLNNVENDFDENMIDNDENHSSLIMMKIETIENFSSFK